MADDWLAWAIGAVVLLGIANVLLKLVATRADAARLPVQELVSWLPVIVLVVLALGGLSVYVLKPSPGLLLLAAGWVLASVSAVALIFIAMQKGSASVITAMLALSAVVVAVLSYFVLGERLSSRQLLGMALAMAASVAFAV